MDGIRGPPLSPPPHQKSYDLLGAPMLAFRNEEAYDNASSIDLLPKRSVRSSDLTKRFRQSRAYARWYYPIDFHRVRPVLIANSKEDGANEEHDDKASKRSKKSSKKKRKNSEATVPIRLEDDEGDKKDDDEDDDTHHSALPETQQGPPIVNPQPAENENMEDTCLPKSQTRKSRRDEQIALARAAKQDQNATAESTDFLSKQTFALQQQARRFILDQSHPQSHVKPLLEAYQKYDVNLYPASISLQSKEVPKYGFQRRLRSDLDRFTRQRQNYADPDYLAPVSRTTLTALKRRDDAVVDDSNNNARKFSNTLCSFACECPSCRGSDNPTWWILHPTGPLLETIRLSPLVTPYGRKIWTSSRATAKYSRKNQSSELDVDDGVYQIDQCGSDMFVARGDNTFTIFRVVENKSIKSQPDESLCTGSTRVLEQIEQVDLRSFIHGALSYRPRNLTTHPRYGSPFTPGRVTVLFEAETRDVTNTLRQYSIGSEVRATEHRISSLQKISDLQYSSSHPMVLWASARSYIHSLPTKDQFRGNPKVGFGSALYSIDLRCDKAIFEWSPSAEEFVPEGIHSLSGLLTEWDRDNTLLLSSISARKTWELDMRMPCRSVVSWSLPYYGDGPGISGGSYGTTGAGMIMDKPKGTKQHRDRNEPVLGVNRTPGTSCLHLYQRPNSSPLFGSWPIEAIQTAQTNSFPGSVATSNVFPLPDIVGPIFTCGLTTIRIPTRELFSPESTSGNKILNYATNSLCVISSTNKGDVYSHALLESASPDSLEKDSTATPFGHASIPIPVDHHVSSLNASGNGLPLNLSNEYPLPSSAILFPRDANLSSQTRHKHRREYKIHNHQKAVKLKRRSARAMSLSTGADKRIKIPRDLVQAQKETFSTTLDCFEEDLGRAQMRQARIDRNMERTDLTIDHLDDAELNWNQGSDQYCHDSDVASEAD